VSVRMTHPASGGEYDAQPGQVPHLQSSGWRVEPGQDDQGEEWPEDLQRFGGQTQVRMRHPDIEGEITVAESAVPYHREKGWQVIDDQAVTEAAQTGDLEDLTVEELKDEARARGLAVSGTKAELIERLRSEDKQDTEQAGDEPAQDEEG
jgi:SAP domain-containing protein